MPDYNNSVHCFAALQLLFSGDIYLITKVFAALQLFSNNKSSIKLNYSVKDPS